MEGEGERRRKRETREGEKVDGSEGGGGGGGGRVEREAKRGGMLVEGMRRRGRAGCTRG